MKILFVMLMLLSGVSVSYYLIKDSEKRRRRALGIYELASHLEELIRYTRTPVSGLTMGGMSIDDLIEHPDGEVVRLTEMICSSDYEAALSYAALLKNHTEKEMQKVKEKEERSRPMAAFLPPAAALLAAILLI